MIILSCISCVPGLCLLKVCPPSPHLLFTCRKGLCFREFSGSFLWVYSSLCPIKSRKEFFLDLHELLMGCLEIDTTKHGASSQTTIPKVSLTVSTQQLIKMTFHSSYHSFLALAALPLHLEISSVSLCESMPWHFRVLTYLRHLFFDESLVKSLVFSLPSFSFLFPPINMGASYIS